VKKIIMRADSIKMGFAIFVKESAIALDVPGTR
jgi:hypothetical protein